MRKARPGGLALGALGKLDYSVGVQANASPKRA